MPRRIDQGDDFNPFPLCIGNDGIHFILGKFILAVVVIVRLVARLNPGGYLVAAVGRIVYRDSHIVQKKPQAVIADCKLQMGISSLRHGVDD